MATPGLSALVASTYKHMQGEFADNCSNGNEFFRYMKMKGSVKVSGGEKIVEELMYAVGNGGSYSGMDPLTISKPEGLSAAEFDWSEYYATVTVEGSEQIRNSGPEKVNDLVKARIKQAEITMANLHGLAIYGDGTGNSGKDLLGLAAICDNDPTTGTLGTINRATAGNEFWRNAIDTITAFNTSNEGLTDMGSMVRTLSRGKDRPKVIVAGNTVFGLIEQAANGRAQFNNPQLADLGFHALKFEGIDVMYDPQCTAARLYFLNTDYLHLNVHSERNYKMGKFIEPADGVYEVAKILWAGQLTVSNCALQGVITVNG